jgi:DNA polymerase III alpha subunit
MIEIDKGLFYLENKNKFVFDNDYVKQKGKKLVEIFNELGMNTEYISDDERDMIYAKSKGFNVYNKKTKYPFDYELIENINLDKEIEKLIHIFSEFKDIILEEYEYLKQNEHNILLLKIAFIVRNFLKENNVGVFMMRGSGINSFILFLIGLNKINPLLYGLDYKDFWKK